MLSAVFVLLLGVVASTRTDMFCTGRDDACEPNNDADNTYTCTYEFSVTQTLSMEYEITQNEYPVSFPVQTDEMGADGYVNLYYNECNTNMYANGNPLACNNTNIYISRDDTSFLGVDGVRRRVTYINGQIPGPTLCVGWKDIVKVEVSNDMGGYGFESVTIHWHGMFQRGTPWMDGVSFVSQCPVETGQKFQYEFEANPAGTFWYHSHMGLQYGDGVFGALIIFDEHEVHKGAFYSDDIPENVMVVNDWAHKYTEYRHHEHPGHWVNDDGSVLTRHTSVDGSFLSGEPYVSALINGYGDFEGNGMEPWVYYVNPGKIVRFRLIGAMSEEPFIVTIDDHPMALIAMDGFDIAPPEPCHGIIVFPAERYDFAVLMNRPFGNYWIRLQTLSSPNPETTLAILSYTNDDVATAHEGTRAPARPVFNTPILDTCNAGYQCLVINCPWPLYYTTNPDIKCKVPGDFRSHPQEPNIKPHPPHREDFDAEVIYLNYNVLGNPQQQRPNIDGIYLSLPPETPLTDPNWFDMPSSCDARGYEEGGFDAQGCTRWIDLKYNQTYIFVLTNRWPESDNPFPGVMAHPSHMHGHSFYILAESAGTVNPAPPAPPGGVPNGCENGIGQPSGYCNDHATLNDELVCTQPWGNCSFPNGLPPLLDPSVAPRKDTIVIPPHGWVIIGIRADNPGWWIWHCHIEGHLAAGMGLLLNEASPETAGLVDRDLPANFPMCTDFSNSARFTLTSISLIGHPNGDVVTLDPPFDPKTTEYTASVTHHVTSVVVNLAPDGLGQELSVNGIGRSGSKVGLVEGDNGIVITAGIEGDPGSRRSYKITVIRAAVGMTVGGGLCTFKPQASGYLGGYACGDDTEYTVGQAQDACCACGMIPGSKCGGITCQDANTCTIREQMNLRPFGTGEYSYKIDRGTPACAFGGELTGQYLSGYACGDSSAYADAEDAHHACCDCPGCSGITIDTNTGSASIRAGGPSSNAIENSYMIQP